MLLENISKRHLTTSLLSVACITLLSGCNYIDAVHNAMPTGYTHHSTKPLSEPRITHSYDKDVYYNNVKVQNDFLVHKDKVDALLEQIKPTLRTISPEDSIFLVSEQKNRDFDDALRLGLRNLGMTLDLTSMARYQLIYTIRDAKKDDFAQMSVKPSHDEIDKLEYFALRLVDTTQGGAPVADAYLIPHYHGFKVPEGYTPVNALQDHDTAIETAAQPTPLTNQKAIHAQPVMDESPMLAPVEDSLDDAYSPSKAALDAENQDHYSHYGQVYTIDDKQASQQPMPITHEGANNITAQ